MILSGVVCSVYNTVLSCSTVRENECGVCWISASIGRHSGRRMQQPAAHFVRKRAASIQCDRGSWVGVLFRVVVCGHAAGFACALFFLPACSLSSTALLHCMPRCKRVSVHLTTRAVLSKITSWQKIRVIRITVPGTCVGQQPGPASHLFNIICQKVMFMFGRRPLPALMCRR